MLKVEAAPLNYNLATNGDIEMKLYEYELICDYYSGISYCYMSSPKLLFEWQKSLVKELEQITS